MTNLGRHDELTDRIDALLPQTQCRRCGYAACRPYAAAVAQGEAINRCPPGGEEVIAALAALTARPIAALDPACGEHGPLFVARVDEARCIGCVLCREACPVDAIVGAPKRMHTVLSALCSGCALCIPPCPVDCIEMTPAGRVWSAADANAARARFERVDHRRGPQSDAATANESSTATGVDRDGQQRRDAIAAARERARARRQATGDATVGTADSKP